MTITIYWTEYDIKTGEELSSTGEVFTYDTFDIAFKKHRGTGGRVVSKDEYSAEVVTIDREKGIRYVTSIIADESYGIMS